MPTLVRDELLPQVEVFGYIGVLSTSEGSMRLKMDWFGTCSDVTAVPIFGGEERAESEVLHLLLDLWVASPLERG